MRLWTKGVCARLLAMAGLRPTRPTTLPPLPPPVQRPQAQDSPDSSDVDESEIRRQLLNDSADGTGSDFLSCGSTSGGQ
ncbi:hypothetical protein J6590_032644 [Homalodisca vitripennis]|nr:hypothetical protein J6590_032644 [Homalodisca vitripennis]